MSVRLDAYTLAMPARGRMVSGFGMRGEHHHNGVDILPSATDDGVYAIAPGDIVLSTPNGARGFGCYGHVLVVRHRARDVGTDVDVYALYAHLASQTHRMGAVHAGEWLGRIGDTNGSLAHPGTTFRDGACSPDGTLDRTRARPSAAHLHFELAEARYPLPSGAPRLNPETFFRERGLGWSEAGRPVALGRVGSDDLETLTTRVPPAGPSPARSAAPGCAAALVWLALWEVLRWL